MSHNPHGVTQTLALLQALNDPSLRALEAGLKLLQQPAEKQVEGRVIEPYVPPTRECPKSRYGHQWKWKDELNRSVCDHCQQQLSDEEIKECPRCHDQDIHPSQEDICSDCQGEIEDDETPDGQWAFSTEAGCWIYE